MAYTLVTVRDRIRAIRIRTARAFAPAESLEVIDADKWAFAVLVVGVALCKLTIMLQCAPEDAAGLRQREREATGRGLGNFTDSVDAIAVIGEGERMVAVGRHGKAQVLLAGARRRRRTGKTSIFNELQERIASKL